MLAPRFAFSTGENRCPPLGFWPEGRLFPIMFRVGGLFYSRSEDWRGLQLDVGRPENDDEQARQEEQDHRDGELRR